MSARLLQFPKPLPSPPDDPAREQRILDHLYVVEAVAGRFDGRVPPSVTYEDLYGAGVIGLIKAVDSWKPAKGPLECWAFLKVKGAIRDSLRRRNWTEANHDELIEDRHDAADERLTPDQVVRTGQLREMTVEALEVLDQREKVIVINHYFQGASFGETAADLGIGSSWASKLHRAALKKARAHFARQGRQSAA